MKNPILSPVSTSSRVYQKLKEAADYASILHRLHSIPHCSHALLIEDDAVASFDWYESTIEAVHRLDEEYGERWMSLKLFTSFRWFDWLVHLWTVCKSLCIVLLGTCAQVWVLNRWLWHRRKSFHNFVSLQLIESSSNISINRFMVIKLKTNH